MAIKLNADSWHYRMFKREFQYSEPPRTLCPYFWITIALCIITPFQMLFRGFDRMMTKIVSVFPKKRKVEKTIDEWEREYKEQREKQKIKQARMEKIGKFFGKVFIFGVVPILLIGLVYGMYLQISKIGWRDGLIAFGVILAFTIILIGFVKLFELFLNRYASKIGRGITKFAIFIATPLRWVGWMIKAGYEKACPLVEWEGDVYKETEKKYHHFD